MGEVKCARPRDLDWMAWERRRRWRTAMDGELGRREGDRGGGWFKLGFYSDLGSVEDEPFRVE